MGNEEQRALQLGQRIWQHVTREQLTVYGLSQRAHVPLAVVRRLVDGTSKQPSVWTMKAIAAALGVSVDYLIDVER
jgi:hypothetical protein